MRALNCTLQELSPALQARTLYQHTVFGLGRYFDCPAELPMPRHPLDFAFLLGLASKVAWYPKTGSTSISSATSGYVLSLAARYWRRELRDFDATMLAIRIGALPQHEQFTVLNDVALNLEMKGSRPMKELAVESKLPREVYDRLTMNLASLEQALIAKDPMMPQHLRNSHAVLVSYPETVNLLSDDEIARLIDAAEIHTQTEVVKAVAAGKGKSDKGLKKLTAADL